MYTRCSNNPIIVDANMHETQSCLENPFLYNDDEKNLHQLCTDGIGTYEEFVSLALRIEGSPEYGTTNAYIAL